MWAIESIDVAKSYPQGAGTVAVLRGISLGVARGEQALGLRE